jgi:CheY-like chemotaxis protein
MTLQPADDQPHLLLVEDDDINACYMQQVLGQHCRCHIVCSVEEATAACHRQPFAAILTDMHLLGGTLDGYAVLEAARRSPHNQTTPVAAVTGMNVPREQFLEVGFDDLLYKPHSPAELLELVQRLIGLR